MKKIILTLLIAVLSAQLYATATVNIQQLENAVPAPGLPVTVSADFSGVSGGVSAFQFDITFDVACLTFTGLQNPALANIQYNMINSTTLRVAWANYAAHSYLNGKLFDLVFTYNGGNSNLAFIGASSSVTAFGAIPVATNFTPGYVHMVSATPGLTIATATGQSGQTVNVPLTANGFYNVGGFTLKINFLTPGVVSGSSVVLANINAAVSSVLTYSYQASGLLSITWTRPSGINISVPDGTKLFDLQFSYAGGSSAINFNTGTSSISQAVWPYNPFTGVTYTNGSIASSSASITANPSDQAINLGANAYFGISASGATSYQWQVSTDGGTTFNALSNAGVYSNVTAATMNITGATASINNYKYKCVAEPGTVSSTAATLTVNPLTVNVKVMLQGPYNTTTHLMAVTLRTKAYFPKSQPYNVAPWNYAGTENVITVPANVVDWVLVELRTGTANATTVMKKAGFVLANGNVVGIDGVNPVTFQGLDINNYYIVVRHRNHLAIMSAASQALSSTSILYDYTTAVNKAYGNAPGPMILSSDNVAVMIGGDDSSNGTARANGTASVNDLTMLRNYVTTYTLSEYSSHDISLDGVVRANGTSSVNDATKLSLFLGTTTYVSRVP